MYKCIVTIISEISIQLYFDREYIHLNFKALIAFIELS